MAEKVITQIVEQKDGNGYVTNVTVVATDEYGKQTSGSHRVDSSYSVSEATEKASQQALDK